MTTRAADDRTPAHPAVLALIAIVLLEVAMLAVGVVLIVIGGIEDGFRPMTIALLVTAALTIGGVLMLAVGLVRRRRRLLGGVLTWQVLQLGSAVVGFQGFLGPTWIGWLLFIPAAIGLILSLSRPVVATYGKPAKDH